MLWIHNQSIIITHTDYSAVPGKTRMVALVVWSAHDILLHNKSENCAQVLVKSLKALIWTHFREIRHRAKIELFLAKTFGGQRKHFLARILKIWINMSITIENFPFKYQYFDFYVCWLMVSISRDFSDNLHQSNRKARRWTVRKFVLILCQNIGMSAWSPSI